MHATLWGKDHVTSGEIATRSVGGTTAIGITRGHHPKAYRYTDPNEDAVAVVSSPHATLLVVADGHNGWPASEAAVTAVLRHFGGAAPRSLSRAEAHELLWEAHESVLEVTQARDSAFPESRTALLVVVATAQRVQWTGMGDCSLRVGSPAGIPEINARRQLFVGYRDMPRSAVARVADHGDVAREAGQWVLAGTDGLDFARPFPAAVLNGDPVAAVRGVIEAAFAGGAGDNVAVGLVAPGGGTPG